MPRNEKPLFFRKSLIFAVAAVFFFACLLFFFIEQKFLNVKSIKFLGDLNCTNQQELENYLKIAGKNILRINSEDEEKLIKKKFLCIKNVSIDKIFPSSIELKILTRTPFGKLRLVKETTPSGELNLLEASPSSGVVTLGSNSYDVETLIIDSDGFVFSKETNANILEVKIVNQEIVLSQTVDHQILDGLTILKSLQDQHIVIKEARILENNILVVTSPIIIFDLNKDKSKQLASLQLILIEAKINLKPVHRIDLRFDKPIVVYDLKEKY